MNRQARRAAERRMKHTSEDGKSNYKMSSSNLYESVAVDSSFDVFSSGAIIPSKELKGRRIFRGFSSLSVTPGGVSATYQIAEHSGLVSKGTVEFPIHPMDGSEAGNLLKQLIDVLGDDFRKFERLR